MSISTERKTAVLAKLLPPYNMTVAVVAQMEGIFEATLYNWRNKAKSEGKPVPSADKNTEQWPAEAHFAAIVETATLSEAEVAEYCRKKDSIRNNLSSGNRIYCKFQLSATKQLSSKTRMKTIS
ncbi:hypothetical protein F4V73_13995 [Morganella psychrotolerans]|uniref:Transposase n=1 Tax=Morganella psychrotolerans TaxID=368603 RepID=A0A5M9R0E0_9GAMM|nr:hypothetical protein F4V73_13995 [Morganella psychrotolerans]